MAYEIGTATDYLDLMDRLNTFLTTNADLVAASQNWTTLRNDSGEYIWQAPGLSLAEEIFVGAQVYENVPSDIYSFRLQGFSGYVDGNTFWNQPSALSEAYTPCLPLWDASIPYWFVANGQRAIVIAKVSSSYQSAYLGKINPFASPTQYPYPLFVGGMTNYETYRYSQADGSNFAAFWRGHNGAHLFSPSGSWLKASQTVNADIIMLPWSKFDSLTSYTNVFQALNNDYPIVTGMIGTSAANGYSAAASTSDVAIFGEFDGVYHTFGTGLSAETIITIDSVDYIVFHSSTSETVNKYALIKLQ